jgi:hypothetical protein
VPPRPETLLVVFRDSSRSSSLNNPSYGSDPCGINKILLPIWIFRHFFPQAQLYQPPSIGCKWNRRDAKSRPGCSLSVRCRQPVQGHAVPWIAIAEGYRTAAPSTRRDRGSVQSGGGQGGNTTSAVHPVGTGRIPPHFPVRRENHIAAEGGEARTKRHPNRDFRQFLPTNPGGVRRSNAGLLFAKLPTLRASTLCNPADRRCLTRNPHSQASYSNRRIVKECGGKV